ncbi:MAG: hypothetical protein ACKO2P_05435 [Planctomycetota bacterium]
MSPISARCVSPLRFSDYITAPRSGLRAFTPVHWTGVSNVSRDMESENSERISAGNFRDRSAMG